MSPDQVVPVPSPAAVSADPLIGTTSEMAFCFENDFFVGMATVDSESGDKYLLKFVKGGVAKHHWIDKEMVRQVAPDAQSPAPLSFAYSIDEGGELLYKQIKKLSASKLLSIGYLDVKETFETVKAMGPGLFQGMPPLDPATGMPSSLEAVVRSRMKALKVKMETAHMRGKSFPATSAHDLGTDTKDALAAPVSASSTSRE